VWIRAPSCCRPHPAHQRRRFLSPGIPQLAVNSPQSSHVPLACFVAPSCCRPHSAHQRRRFLSPGIDQFAVNSPQSSHRVLRWFLAARAPSCCRPHAAHQRRCFLSPGIPQLAVFSPQSSHNLLSLSWLLVVFCAALRRAGACCQAHSAHQRCQRFRLPSPTSPQLAAVRPHSWQSGSWAVLRDIAAARLAAATAGLQGPGPRPAAARAAMRCGAAAARYDDATRPWPWPYGAAGGDEISKNTALRRSY
jgi:hypothetical protein